MNLPRTLWRLLFAALLAGIALAATGLLITTLSVLLLIFAGVLFGVFVNGLSGSLHRHTPLSYRWSYAIIALLIIGLIVGGFYYMGSQVGQQISELSQKLQSAGDRLNRQLNQYPWIQRYLPEMSEIRSNVTDGGSGIFPEVMRGVRWLLWGITGLVVIFFVGLYVAYDPHLYEAGLVKLVPPERRDHACEILRKLRTALGRWIIGRIISMSIIGVFTAIGLWLLNVPLPVTLGVLAALLTFIPNIGPILAAIPQALLALQVGMNTVLYVILFNIALQTIESYMVTPIVQRYEVTLPPALTIFVQLLMAVVVGPIGIIMAAPLTVTAMVLIQMLYIRDELGDPRPGRLVERTEEGG